MGLIREPKDVDVTIKSEPWTKEELKKFETEIGPGRKIERLEQEEEVEHIDFRFRIVLLDRAQLNINYALTRGNNGFVCSK